MSYSNEIKKSMQMLSKNSKTIFLGQSVEVPGNLLFKSLEYVHKKKKIELPVFEETQMGMSIGFAMEGFVPITIFPRFNFLLPAINQLVNHLDKIKEYSNNEFNPKVIIRTSIGSIKPLDPQSQHRGDFTNSLKLMLKNIDIIKLNNTNKIFNAYKKAYQRKDNKSTILVEYADYYNEK